MPDDLSRARIRPATMADLGAINRIYNYYVDCSTCTYAEAHTTAAERQTWFAAHGPAHPVTVMELDGSVLAWASLSPYHLRSGYRFTVENSLYVDPAYQRRGIGARLLADLIARAASAGHRVVIAAIDSEQQPSLALHAKFAFRQVGRLEKVGYKFGRWLDVIYLQRDLAGP